MIRDWLMRRRVTRFAARYGPYSDQGHIAWMAAVMRERPDAVLDKLGRPL